MIFFFHFGGLSGVRQATAECKTGIEVFIPWKGEPANRNKTIELPVGLTVKIVALFNSPSSNTPPYRAIDQSPAIAFSQWLSKMIKIQTVQSSGILSAPLFVDGIIVPDVCEGLSNKIFSPPRRQDTKFNDEILAFKLRTFKLFY